MEPIDFGSHSFPNRPHISDRCNPLKSAKLHLQVRPVHAWGRLCDRMEGWGRNGGSLGVEQPFQPRIDGSTEPKVPTSSLGFSSILGDFRLTSSCSQLYPETDHGKCQGSPHLVVRASGGMSGMSGFWWVKSTADQQRASVASTRDADLNHLRALSSPPGASLPAPATPLAQCWERSDWCSARRMAKATWAAW